MKAGQVDAKLAGFATLEKERRGHGKEKRQYSQL